MEGAEVPPRPWGENCGGKKSAGKSLKNRGGEKERRRPEGWHQNTFHKRAPNNTGEVNGRAIPWGKKKEGFNTGPKNNFVPKGSKEAGRGGSPDLLNWGKEAVAAMENLTKPKTRSERGSWSKGGGYCWQ